MHVDFFFFYILSYSHLCIVYLCVLNYQNVYLKIHLCIRVYNICMRKKHKTNLYNRLLKTYTIPSPLMKLIKLIWEQIEWIYVNNSYLISFKIMYLKIKKKFITIYIHTYIHRYIYIYTWDLIKKYRDTLWSE